MIRSRARRALCLRDGRLRLVAGQPLVDQVHRQPELRAQGGRELLHSFAFGPTVSSMLIG